MAANGETFLVAVFREFYREVLRLRRKVESGDWLPDPEREREAPASGSPASGLPAPSSEPSETATVAVALPARVPQAGAPQAMAPPPSGSERPEAYPPPGVAPAAVWQELVSFLERQALYARRVGGDFASQVYLQAQYAMAALADEVFLHDTDWGGRETWKSHLLEAKLFGTHRAGEEIFDRIDAVLESGDRVYVELARIYLMALGLGFEGKYRARPGGDAQLAVIRQRLFTFVTQREPAVLEGRERIFPAAYASTLDQGEERKLPHLRPWAWALAILVVLWVTVSFPVWRQVVDDLTPLLDGIL